MPIKPNTKRRSMRQFCLANGYVYNYRQSGDCALYECSYVNKHGILKYKLKSNFKRRVTLKRIFGVALMT